MFHLVGDILFCSNPLYLPCSQGPTSFFVFLMVDQGIASFELLIGEQPMEKGVKGYKLI